MAAQVNPRQRTDQQKTQHVPIHVAHARVAEAGHQGQWYGVLDFAHKRAGGHYNPSGNRLNALTGITGLVLGTMVALTSIGAGALGTVALFILYPMLPTRRLVGTEIAHAVPLTLVAGLGHASMGNMDWHVLGYLLIGSLPGIYLGSHLTGRISDEVLRPCLATMLVLIGYKLAF